MTDLLIDEVDREILATHSLGKNGQYVIARDRATRKTQPLHRLITSAPDGFVVDHLDGNGYNNQRANLRVCTISANATNRLGSILLRTKPFCGVVWSEEAWEVRICVESEVKIMGRFVSASEASTIFAEIAPAKCTCSLLAPAEMAVGDTTYQRIYKDTQKKLQAITTVHKPKVTVPALLEVLTDKEFSKYKELAASEQRADEAEKGSK